MFAKGKDRSPKMPTESSKPTSSSNRRHRQKDTESSDSKRRSRHGEKMKNSKSSEMNKSKSSIKKMKAPINLFEAIKSKFLAAGDVVSKLDSHWTAMDAGLNRIMFKEIKSSIKFWCPPKELWECLFGMPYSIEVAIDMNGFVYFINHSKGTTSNIHPLENVNQDTGQPATYEEKTFTFEFQVPLKSSTCGLTLVKKDKAIYIESIEKGSRFQTELLEGDILLSINSNSILEVDDINVFFNDKTSIVLKILRGISIKNKIFAVNENGPKKSCLRNPARDAYLQTHPVKVHFSERPYIFQYRNQNTINSWEQSSIEKNFSDILKVKLPTGVIRTMRFTRTQTVYEFVSDILKKVSPKITSYNYFTLGLTEPKISSIEYFSPEQPVYTIYQKKKTKPSLECHLLLYAVPHKIKDWSHEKYGPMVDFLYHQCYLMLVHSKMLDLYKISTVELHQLIALASIIGYLLAGLSHIESKISSNETHTANKTVDRSKSVMLNTEFKPKLTPGAGISNSIRLSTYKLEQWSFIPKDSPLRDLRPDLDDYSIISLMINAFNEITTNDMKIFFLGDPSCFESLNIVCDQNFRDRVYGIIHEAEMVFIQCCLDLKIVSYMKFRVLVCISPFHDNSKMKRQVGTPSTMVVTPNSIIVELPEEKKIKIEFSTVTAIVASYRDLDHFIINVFINEPSKVLCFSTPIDEFRLIFCTLACYANTIWDEVPERLVPVIDLTNNEYRSDSHRLPSYHDIHIVMPSFWSFASPPGEFFNACQKILNSDSENECLDEIFPFMVMFQTDMEPSNNCKKFQTSGLRVPIHLNPFLFSPHKYKNIRSNTSNPDTPDQSNKGKDKDEVEYWNEADVPLESAFSKNLLTDEIDRLKSNTVSK